MAKRNLVPRGIPLCGENEDGKDKDFPKKRSVTLLFEKCIGGRILGGGVFAEEGHFHHAILQHSQNTGRNYELVEVDEPRANSLTFVTSKENASKIDFGALRFYRAFDGKKFGRLIIDSRYHSSQPLIEKDSYLWRFFEVRKVS